MRQLRVLQTDVVALLLVGLGAGSLFGQYRSVLENYGPTVVRPFVIFCLFACVMAVPVALLGRRRDRQRRLEQARTRRRGYAGKTFMPLGDQVATVIARSVLTFVVCIVLLAILKIVDDRRIIYVGLSRPLEGSVALLVLLGGTAGIGLWTARRLRAQNRRLAEPVCPQCQYVLYGVQGRRCPECGEPFNLDEVNMNLVQLDEQGRLQPKDPGARALQGPTGRRGASND